MKMRSLLAGLTLFLGATMLMAADAANATGGPLDLVVKDIDGKDVNLADYKGKVVMIVNVASKCGNTKQYTDLEKIYGKYKDQGFTILAFPANNFGGQEPGSNEQIKNFCTAEDSKYKITFPLMAKISVKGDDKHALYKVLTAADTQPVKAGEVTWNFEKFLIGRDGKVAARFAPKTNPQDAKVVESIEAELKKETKAASAK